MLFDRLTLVAAIKASGGAEQPHDQLDGLLAILAVLEKTGRYGGLFATLAKVNDKSNFLAFLLEATFAFQFETAGMPLAYEVRQFEGQTSSIDFRLDAATGDAVFFELRLLQQESETAQGIAEQLAKGPTYEVALDGEDEQAAVARLQSTVLQKVQKKDGTPTKFLRTGAGVVNVVVVGVSDILLGTLDSWDCVLAMYGDPEVPEHCRRDVFGLFQDTKPEYPAEVQARAASYKHIKGTLHGVLFVFCAKGGGVLDYQLQQVMVWNRTLVNADQAKTLMGQIAAAVSARPVDLFGRYSGG